MAHDILIVDDEADIRMLIGGVLKDEGYATREAADSTRGAGGDAGRGSRPWSSSTSGCKGSELDGIEILKQLRAEMPSVPVVMISGHGTIETAVEAIKIGAYDFIEKPFKSDRLLLVVERAIEAALLRRENEELRLRAGGEIDLVGASASASQLRQQIERVAPTGSRVLITGAARRRQGGRRRGCCMQRSRRADGPFVVGQLRDDAARPARDRAVRHRNRRAMARPRKIGTFERAHGGTLVSRRGRRHAARDPGQDRARAAGADLRAGRRLAPGRGRCPRHRLDQPRPRRRDRRRPLPRGSVSTASTWCRSACRRCASGARTSRCWRAISWRASAEAARPAAARVRRGRHGGAAGLRPGPAMCASCATSSTGC